MCPLHVCIKSTDLVFVDVYNVAQTSVGDKKGWKGLRSVKASMSLRNIPSID